MGQEINFLDVVAKTVRDYDKRARDKTEEDVRIAKEFGWEFFDGPRSQGYGGYVYDGRWKAVAERMRDHYELAPDAAILDIGAAKGFLMHDFKELMPDCTVEGCDVSEYAIENALEDMKPHLKIASGHELPYEDDSFDLVISINSIHNLPPDLCKQALREIQRVTRAHAWITVDAWRNEEERENLFKWVLTAETMMHVDDWRKVFDEVGYEGDYWWFIAD
jgi:ubiquinone/menaquinone biosynthesis C-methylase UbiE